MEPEQLNPFATGDCCSSLNILNAFHLPLGVNNSLQFTR